MASGLDAILLALGVAYPFVIYFGLRILPPGFFAFALLALIGLRLARGRKQGSGNTLPYLIAAVGLLIVAARSPMIGLKAYPVMVSLALASAFGYSLLRPPPSSNNSRGFVIRICRSRSIPTCARSPSRG